MPTPRFFIEEPIAGQQQLKLPPAVARHALDVLRLRVGDGLILFDGTGGEHQAQLLSVRPATAQIERFDAVERESTLPLTLVQSLITNEKLDWVIEKATELGAQRIVIARTERSVVRLSGERLERRIEHWRNVAIAACCQCGRNRVPQLTYAAELSAVVEACADIAARWVLDPLAHHRLSAVNAAQSHVAWIGPEGGLTDSELGFAARSGFTRVQLGPRVLRTETAGLAALSALQAMVGDFALPAR